MAAERRVGVSEPVSDYVQGLASKIITPQIRGGGRFADPVKPAADAGILDRLIAYTGRNPVVAQTSTN